MHASVAVRTPAPYLGGKRNLAKRICALIATIPHNTYVEPFVGMGGIFLRRGAKPRVEVINDISADVTTLFRVLQRHHEAFLDMLKWQITSRAEFERLRASDPTTLTDLERAARFLYLQRLAFGGKIEGRAFGIDRRTPARFDVAKLRDALPEIHDRLTGVVIERLPYADLIRRYDGDDVLFYLDPPYWDCEHDYGAGLFAREDFERIAEQLAAIKGRFVMSINDTPGIRAIFGRFELEQVNTTYTIATASSGGGIKAGELIVTN